MSVVYECVYIWSLYLSRLSILVFYLSLFHLSRFASIAVKTCIVLTSIVAVTFLFIDIFICHPINTVSIKCDANRALVGSVLSGLSVLFDIVVLNIPIIAIWKMRLSQSRKISLVVIFSSGLLFVYYFVFTTRSTSLRYSVTHFTRTISLHPRSLYLYPPTKIRD